MQNFFDANREAVDQIEVSLQNRTVVVISAPTAYELERLFYLGSEKGEEDVGQYGEGFKAAATCLLRDHNVTPVAVSEKSAVVLRIADTPAVKDSNLYPVVYDFFEIEESIPGTRLILSGCQRPLIDAMRLGLTHFLYEGNELLGRCVWTSYNEDFALYESEKRDGYVFYRNLRRGVIEDIPVVLVINKQYKNIEKLIEKDRDRKAFGGKLMDEFYRRFVGGLGYARSEVMDYLLLATKARWERGVPLLATLANLQRYPSTDNELFDEYYATSKPHNDSDTIEYRRLEKEWEQEGKKRLPAYFSILGATSAEKHLRKIRERARKDTHRKNSRAPTDVERDCLAALAEVLRELSPSISTHFESQRTHYTVAKTEVVLGELKQSREYKSRDLFFAESVFESDFPLALAVYLHEHAHIFGYDGDRRFTDALTELIEVVVRNRKSLDVHESAWKKSIKAVQTERATNGQSKQRSSSKALIHQLDLLDAEDLRDLLGKIPPIEVKRALSQTAGRKE
ncbi:hypothetical protein [Bythopirellula goksoeyrii]|uniref:hypothetical protein n=1 Tax=Bythopirellula goksoeyrii TaxID=1400387 RepID=UPI0011CDE4D2|nr:hypothetical protein [Bythopirellula goksoeyrii]